MRPASRGAHLRVAAVLLAAWPAVATASEAASAPAAPEGAEFDPDRLAAVAEKAIHELERATPQDPIAYLSLAVLHRRFPIAAFADMRVRYLQALAAAEGDQRRLLQVFLRLLYPTAVCTPEDLAAVPEGIDRLTSRALHCDRLGLPADYDATMRQAIDDGGYLLTHAGLALKWIRENGCDTEWTRALEPVVLERLAAIPNADSRVTDLELEAATFLYYWGRDDLVPDGFVAAALAAQGEDGGWSPDSEQQPEARHWHPTSLALWMLLERATREDVPMVPR